MIDIALDNNVVLKEEIDAAVQELDVLFSTENTELLGAPEFGTNWWKFLWECTPSPNELKNYIDEKLKLSCYYFTKFDYDVSVEVQYDEGGEPVYIVHVSVKHPVSSHRKASRTKVYMLR